MGKLSMRYISPMMTPIVAPLIHAEACSNARLGLIPKEGNNSQRISELLGWMGNEDPVMISYTSDTTSLEKEFLRR